MEAKLRSVNCDVCGSKDSKLIVVENGYNVVRCDRCGLVYVNPQPAEEAIMKLYGSGFSQNDPRLNFESRLGKRKSFHKYLTLIEERFLGKGTVLDVGCGNGDFLELAKASGWKVTGLEINKDAATYVSERTQVDIYAGSASNIDKINITDEFDVITMWSVLEHTTDPYSVTTNMYKMLRRGGLLAIIVPNMAFHLLRIRLFPFLGYRDKKRVYLDAPMHLFGFAPKTMRLLLDKVGFSKIDFCTGEPRKAGGILARFARRALYTFARIVFFLTRRRVLLSSSMLILARKSLLARKDENTCKCY